jgi:hypothetical protein
MKNDGISQSEPRKVKIDQEKVSQLVAVLQEMWPDLSPVKPELKVVSPEPKTHISSRGSDPGTVNRLNQLLRENLPEEFKREIGAYEFARPAGKSDSLATQSAELSRILREINGRSRCDQLNALLDEKWGPVQNEKPRKPMIDRSMVDRLKAKIRETWPDEFGSTANVIEFPRAKKRGAKVRTGPCARVIPLSGIYIGEELDERFEFMRRHASDWQTEDMEGMQAVDWDRRNWIEAAFENRHNRPMTDHDKCKQVAEGRARIETRNRIKAYLERRGVDLDKICNAEDALFALFGFVELAP